MKLYAALLSMLVGSTLTCYSANSPQVKLSADLAHPNIPASQKFTTYLKVGITGFEIEKAAKRAPVNVSIVIDKSGSMSGDKIINAREAAKQALDRLGPDDIVSVIAYDSTVHVICSASGLSEREDIKKSIDAIMADGSTALFSGVSKAAEELRKNKKSNIVNRIVLLSDGMANIGPSTPQELGRLGTSLAKEGITVTTLGLGLGYNEDLMTELALRSDGNHSFIQDSEKLAEVFQTEFGDILSVVAQNIRIKIECAEGIRPVRSLGRDADIRGKIITHSMNQLYAKQNKFLMIEVEVEPGVADTDAPIANIQLSYSNAITDTEETLNSRSVARRVDSTEAVTVSTNKEVLIEVAKFIATEKEALAVKLSDEGKHADAAKAYDEAANWAEEQSQKLDAPELKKLAEEQQGRNSLFKQGGDGANAARKMSKDADFKQRTQNKSGQ